jgi:CarD family transcriptional regulator
MLNEGENNMFNIGDKVIYSSQGICIIDDICEKEYFGATKNYYILHPLENPNLIISTPVDNNKVTMLELVDRDEAERIIESFRQPGMDWIESWDQRNQTYSEIVKRGNRFEISGIVNTLMRKKHEAETVGKKLSAKDIKLLDMVQNTLFSELAMSLNTTLEAIQEKVYSYINENVY